MLPPTSVDLSGDRFSVIYRLTGSEAEARGKADDICIEQTIEFPADLVPDDDIRRQIFGRIESFRPLDGGAFEAVISYAVEISGFELSQLLNVVFGNISLKPGIRVERLALPDSLLQAFKGPRFGRDGWRELLNAPRRPLLCSALKPMGLSAAALAEMAYKFALGGVDLIKDDHGLANQSFSPFKERVERCVEAIDRANRESGHHCAYIPNITGPANELTERAIFAKETGAGAIMAAPGLIGLDSVRMLADDDRINLPIMSHPAFQGSYITSPDNGFSHFALYGQVSRLAGADATVYPNWGGRFSFSKEECASIVAGTAAPLGQLQPIFPAPGGGMTMKRVPEMLDVYGRDVIFLMGGGLHKHGPDLIENCRHFRQLVEKM